MKWRSYLLALWVFGVSVLPCDCDSHAGVLPSVSAIQSAPVAADDCRDSRSEQIPCSPFCQTCHHAMAMPMLLQIDSPETEGWQDEKVFPTLCFRIFSRATTIWQPPRVQLG
jgi:hypothetical protein